jgi:hypothetical protein
LLCGGIHPVASYLRRQWIAERRHLNFVTFHSIIGKLFGTLVSQHILYYRNISKKMGMEFWLPGPYAPIIWTTYSCLDRGYCQNSMLQRHGKIGYTYRLYCTGQALADADNVYGQGRTQNKNDRVSPTKIMLVLCFKLGCHILHIC